MILLGSIFQVHEPSVLLVDVLIHFGVKKQVPQVSFKISVGDLISFHTFGYDMELFGYDMILFRCYLILLVSIFQVHELSVLLVAVLINFGVKKQVLQVSFKIVAGDLISLHSFGYDMNLFGSDLFSDLIICGSGFKIQELTVLLVTGFINFGVTNQAPQVSFIFVAEDSMLVFSYEIYDIRFCELLVFFKLYHIMELKHLLSTVLGLLYLWSHAHLLTELVKTRTFFIYLDTCS